MRTVNLFVCWFGTCALAVINLHHSFGDDGISIGLAAAMLVVAHAILNAIYREAGK
jgi:hypothetical protein